MRLKDGFQLLENERKELKAFYGDIDFIPTEEYSREDADQAREGARRTVDTAVLLNSLWTKTGS
jgi:hypothetical protein